MLLYYIHKYKLYINHYLLNNKLLNNSSVDVWSKSDIIKMTAARRDDQV